MTKIIEEPLPGLFVIELKRFQDDRGYFCETFNQKTFQGLGISTNFVQDNLSFSKKGTLRGLHFQNPTAQAKLVRCPLGTVWDVAVDLRRSSPTFGKHFGLTLSDKNNLAMYVPVGFAHGFCVMSEEALFEYKCSNFYSPQDDRGVFWRDPKLNIPWPLKELGVEPILSAKDLKLPTLAEQTHLFD